MECSGGSVRSVVKHLPSVLKALNSILEEHSETEKTEATPLLPLRCKKHSRVEGALSSTMSFCNCRMALANHKLGVDLLAIFFGIGAWIGINGMYVQLPLIVQTQPEGWNLPSYLSIIIQVANIGPISYTLLEKFWPNKVKDSWLICGILSLGSTSVILMAFLYQKTTYIGGEEHSTALFALVFFIALVGCTSSVLFMPFMRHFRDIYLISYYVGEGLSGFVPSIAALIQGVGGNPTCINQTYDNGTSHVVSYTSPPRFSTQSFFIFLFCMFLLSNISFILLNNLNWCKTEKVYLSTRKNSLRQSGQNSPVAITRLQSEDKSISEEDITEANKNAGFISSSNGVALYEEFNDPNQMARSSSTQNRSLLSRRVYVYYLVLVSWLCLFGNGLFPGIQSYSCLPYGNVAYHLSVTLGSMANPLACFLAFFLPYSSVRATSLMALICTLISCYIATTAVMSPSPPLVGTTGGEALVVSSLGHLTPPLVVTNGEALVVSSLGQLTPPLMGTTGGEVLVVSLLGPLTPPLVGTRGEALMVSSSGHLTPPLVGTTGGEALVVSSLGNLTPPLMGTGGEALVVSSLGHLTPSLVGTGGETLVSLLGHLTLPLVGTTGGEVLGVSSLGHLIPALVGTTRGEALVVSSLGHLTPPLVELGERLLWSSYTATRGTRRETLVVSSLGHLTPPLVGTTGGEALVVLSWVVFTGLISYIKVSVATLFRLEGGRALFWCGAVQQMGSAAGAILGFFLVNFGDIFHTYFPCQDS
uniref:Solute carrier family 52, riboflavin transporter, member 3-A n=1 Tax=Timema tahoe TaxID=61484 RepID=A0A7R9FIL0_9NEOP|nr:unnamed protein product [Timema tahoe]